MPKKQPVSWSYEKNVVPLQRFLRNRWQEDELPVMLRRTDN
jgi:hypothetical protein